jgi:hypothetical protein
MFKYKYISWLFTPYFGASAATIFLCGIFGMGLASVSKELESPWSLPYGIATIVLPMVFGYLADSRLVGGVNDTKAHFPGLKGETANSLATAAGVISAIGCFCSIANLYLHNALSTDMALARSMMFDGFQASILSYTANIMIPFGIISIAVTITHYEVMSSTAAAIGLLFPFIGQVFLGYFLAGRYIVVSLLVLAIWFAVHRPFYGRSIIPKRLMLNAMALAIGVFVFAGSAYISIGRSVKDDQAAFAVELAKDQVQLSPGILSLIDTTPPALAAVIAEGCLYWTTSIVTFDIAFQNWIGDPNYVGAFHPFLRRRLAAFGLIATEDEEWNRWTEISLIHNFYSGTWATTSFDIIKTCGRIGAIFVLPGLGFATGIIYKRFKQSGSIITLSTSAVLWLFFFFWYQRSIFLEPIFEFFMVLAAIHLVTNRFRKGRGKQMPNS